MDARFEQFIKERIYLQNVSPATVEWYRQSLKWLPSENPSEDDLKNLVIKMRQDGLKATSCNCRIRAINSYLKWSGSSLKIPKLKEPQRVLPTFSQKDIQKFMSWKPKTVYDHRLQVLVLTLADTGCRIGEVLGLRWTDIDFDNLLMTVCGKGDRERKIPFSLELRRFLWKHRHEHPLVFCARRGQSMGRRVVLRDVKRLCGDLGIQVPERTLHAFRHSFALNYLRRGGSVFHLQKTLGHSSLEMTRRYSNLLTEDLQAVHQRVSLLAS